MPKSVAYGAYRRAGSRLYGDVAKMAGKPRGRRGPSATSSCATAEEPTRAGTSGHRVKPADVSAGAMDGNERPRKRALLAAEGVLLRGFARRVEARSRLTSLPKQTSAKVGRNGQ